MNRRGAVQILAVAPLACMLTPTAELGPFFVDEKLNRSDLTSGAEGMPLSLRLDVVKVSENRCVAVPAAQVDVWHANAHGVYSDERFENSLGTTYLRGYQVTDANGSVRFRTIYPGWYPGRTPHIHVMIRAANARFVTQLFFDDAVTNLVYARAPYDGRDTRRLLSWAYAPNDRQPRSSHLLV